MIYLGGWIALITFWFYVLRLIRLDEKRTGMIFGCIWLAAYFGFPQIGVEGPLYFISFEALLSLILIFIDLYLTNMKKRNPQENPLGKIQE